MIILVLKRKYKKSTYTIGQLFINGEYFCDTLEDRDRNLSQCMTEEQVDKIKVYGKTAIPAGTYTIDMNTVSQRFKGRSWAKPWGGKLPRLQNVPGYEGVLIHVGNTSNDTSGCILVGQNKAKGQVLNSTSTFNKLMERLTKDDDIKIIIE